MACIFSLVAILMFAVGPVFPSPVAEEPSKELAKRDSSSCLVNGHLYRNGEVFTLGNSRCIKYRCNNGQYDFYQEECDVSGVCKPVGQRFWQKCTEYVCNVKHLGGGYRQYQVSTVQQKCEDNYGQCHEPGQQFDFYMRGSLRRHCTCNPRGDYISYSCRN